MQKMKPHINQKGSQMSAFEDWWNSVSVRDYKPEFKWHAEQGWNAAIKNIEEYCLWENIGGGEYNTGCHNEYYCPKGVSSLLYHKGGEFNFCPYCSKKIKEVLE